MSVSYMNILGHTYTVRKVDHLDGLMGRHRLTTCEIEISDKLTPSQEESTLIHEVLEAINGIMELELTHPQISALEACLYQVISSNHISIPKL